MVGCCDGLSRPIVDVDHMGDLTTAETSSFIKMVQEVM